ncbi:MAG: leucyl aminopeptidase [Betaproteobacteria bacterium]|jgi:leucyl aminopeptidase|nr:leucyl aminopeptidase [Betaproteobacteria bacterium]
MEFSTKAVAPGHGAADCCVVGVFTEKKLSAPAAALDKLSGSRISRVIARGDIDGRPGTTLLLHDVANLACARVLLVGLGDKNSFSEKAFRRAIAASVEALCRTGTANAAIHLTELATGRRDAEWRLMQAARIAGETVYRFSRMKSTPPSPAPLLRSITFSVSKPELKQAAQGLARGRALASGINFARDLGNLPGNVCTPAFLAEEARKLAREHRLKLKVLERADMEKLGMNTLLSVAAGSSQPPKLIVLEYMAGPKSQKPVVLVGKGVTFDTGGISLKPAAEMDEMKFDMSGAGSVLGTLKALAEMKLQVNVVGLVPATENMPGGRATKPGDIVTSMSGQTVEILNTDAEGRLILCDTLTYAERYQPAAVIDIATLTGACVIALGHVLSGLFANDDALAQEVLKAGDISGDRAWHLPLHEEYQEQLHSNFADFANIGGRPAGAVTAACFLSRFTKKYKWAHLDVAGTAWKSGKEKGSTGRPVPMLTEFLLRRAAKRR